MSLPRLAHLASRLTLGLVGLLTLAGWLFWMAIACYFAFGFLMVGLRQAEATPVMAAFLSGVVLLVVVFPALIIYGLVRHWPLGSLAMIWLGALSIHWTLNRSVSVLEELGALGVSVGLVFLAIGWKRVARRRQTRQTCEAGSIKAPDRPPS